MQRDLQIALAEYAPGSEVIRGEFPNTYIYRSAGVYDRFNPNPDYSPSGMLVECSDCQSVTLVRNTGDLPDQCEECGSFQVTPLPYLQPRGFTVDCALPNVGRERYVRGGRERGGYVLPARLLVGQTSFSTGKPQLSFAPRLYVRVRQGELFICNKGPNSDFPGFIICPACGRAEEGISRRRTMMNAPAAALLRQWQRSRLVLTEDWDSLPADVRRALTEGREVDPRIMRPSTSRILAAAMAGS